ncbi:MAG: hypothetical protein JXA20_03370 [Spirochaetes bacterium]|nr:hypothetical protein [Spirochaetota bacterium]
MKFFIPALLVGAVINLFVLSPVTGIELRARWTGLIGDIANLERSTEPARKGVLFPLWTQERLLYLDENGAEIARLDSGESMLTASSGGTYAARFEKVGNTVELLNMKGERFWKDKTREYPALSYSGRLLLLMNADQSRIRILDNSGNEIGDRQVNGRFCTVLAFSSPGDNAAAGFMDGSYHFIGEKGNVLYSGRVRAGNVVKSIAVSPSGTFGAVHYGSPAKDCVDIIGITDRRVRTMPLSKVHLARTAINAGDDGRVAVLDRDAVVVADDDGDVLFSLKVRPVRTGYAGIQRADRLYGVHYTMTDGEAAFLLFTDDGKVVMDREFTSETYLQCMMRPGLILLRGSDGLYCYSVIRPRSL